MIYSELVVLNKLLSNNALRAGNKAPATTKPGKRSLKNNVILNEKGSPITIRT